MSAYNRFDSRDLTLLIVDDSEIVLSFARNVLKKLNMPLHLARNGREALEVMTLHQPDIVVTDIMMPEMDGFDLIRRIRTNGELDQTYIIVMTSLDQVEDKVKALEMGANDYTVKPLEADELKARVRAGVREIQLKKRLTNALRELDKELRLVGELQKRLLPGKPLRSDHCRSAVYYQPCRRAGGDYYDWFEDESGRVFLIIGDVSGHGASAAVLMGILRALIKVYATKDKSAAEVVSSLNRALMDNIGDEPDFVSLFLAVWDPVSRVLNYTNAGQGDIFLLGPGKNGLLRLPAGGTVLGEVDGVWDEEFLGIETGWNLVMYTDGLTEAVNRQDEEYGRIRLTEFLGKLPPESRPGKLIDMILDNLNEFTDDVHRSDDVTLFVVQFL